MTADGGVFLSGRSWRSMTRFDGVELRLLDSNPAMVETALATRRSLGLPRACGRAAWKGRQLRW